MPLIDFERYGPKFGELVDTPLNLMRKLDSQEQGWRKQPVKYALLIFKEYKHSSFTVRGLEEYCQERNITWTWIPARGEFFFEAFSYDCRIVLVPDNIDRCLGIRTDYYCYVD